MKKGLVLISLIIFSISLGYGQLAFGVSPGLGLNSAYFGYKVNNKLVPFIGFQHLNVNYKYEESGERYNYDTDAVLSYTETSTVTGSVYIPNIGLKYFLKEQNKIKAYASISISKPFISGKQKNDDEIDNDFDENVKSMKAWGAECGVGAEYFFDDNFSLGGEFGLRYLHLRFEETYETGPYYPNYVTGDVTEKVKLNASPTFSKISLNYYF